MVDEWQLESGEWRAWLAGTTGSIVQSLPRAGSQPGPWRGRISFRVKINGQAPAKGHGIDVDETGYGADSGKSPLSTHSPGGEEAKGDHLFEIEFLKGGAEVYALPSDKEEMGSGFWRWRPCQVVLEPLLPWKRTLFSA